MKELNTKIFQDTIRKPDLSKLSERYQSFCKPFKLKNILSLKSLIALGFVVAIIPLFFAVLYAAFGMRETSTLGRAINSQVFEQTKTIRLVLQKTADIERKARLFILLSDPALRQPYEKQSYESTRESFRQALNDLLKLHVDNKIALLVNELSEKEKLIYQQIIGSIKEDGLKLPVDEAFQGLRESSYNLSSEFESHVDRKFNELRVQSDSLEQGLLIKGAVLLIISIISMTLLLAVLSRSIRQLDACIRRLGSGDLGAPIDVAGPADMRYLGRRLEWLRTHLLDLEHSKQQFMHNVAQEIESPLSNISEGAKRLTETGQMPVNERQDIAQLLCNNIEKLKTVSEELIRYSQISSNPALNRKESVNMKQLLESVIEDLQMPLQHKSISVKKLVKPVEVSGVPEQLRSIIEQLISNALKYSPPGGEIRIMLRDAGAQMELEVEDEGPGVEPNERPHVFEPFFRGKASPYSDDNAGPGLGLAIVKEYVAHHQGKVEIIDPRQDHLGARIRVQIPLPATS